MHMTRELPVNYWWTTGELLVNYRWSTTGELYTTGEPPVSYRWTTGELLVRGVMSKFQTYLQIITCKWPVNYR